MRYYYNHKEGKLNQHEQIEHRTPGWLASLAAIDHALCDDGVRRNVKISGEPDTFFSVPACVTVKGKTVSGYLTTDNGEWLFHATGKNRDVIKKWLCECQARHCECHSKKYKNAVVSMLDSHKALCSFCAPKIGDLGLYAMGCEAKQIESDTYYGSLRGISGEEYRKQLDAQYSTEDK